MSAFRFQIIAVTAENTCFDLTIALVKQVLVYCPSSDGAHFRNTKCPITFLARDIKICLGFSASVLKKAHQNLIIFSEIPTNLHISF